MRFKYVVNPANCGVAGEPREIEVVSLDEVLEIEAERDRCHELIDEFFEHPRGAEPLDVKVGRLLTDAVVLLKERDELLAALKLALTTPGIIRGRVEAEAAIARAEKQ